MKYPGNPKFTMVSENRCLTLFKYLLRHYQEFTELIGGGEFEKTPYHQIFYPTIVAEYRLYRIGRVGNYRWARLRNKPHQIPPLRSFEEFKATFEFPVLDLQLEMFRLYIMGIESVFEEMLIIQDGNYNCFKTLNDFEEILFTAALMVTPGAEHLTIVSLFDYDTYNDNVDLRPVYRYIFGLLKRKGLYGYYDAVDREIFDQLIQSLEALIAEVQIQQILNEDETSEMRIHAAEEEEDQDEKESIPEIPPLIRAYHDVYGCCPENYPKFE